MRTALFLFVIVFCLFCGLLVIESGLFENRPQAEQRCILLQQTTTNEKQDTASGPALENESASGGADFANFSAVGGPEKNVILGAKNPKTEDHETGYKFQLELSSKGAAIRKATFSNGLHNGRPSGFSDRDYENPQPLQILSPVRQADGSEILSIANKEFILVQQNRQFAL
ncbi:MAG: hypothetical protein ACETVZ_06375, partial [Phycisphaerae bacterium]